MQNIKVISVVLFGAMLSQVGCGTPEAEDANPTDHAQAALISVLGSETIREDDEVIGSQLRQSSLKQGEAGLSMFYFRFKNDDHHLRRVGMLRSPHATGATVMWNFRDQNYDDPYDFQGAWRRLPDEAAPRKEYVVTTTCPKGCSVALQGGSPNKTFVMTGFDFEYDDSGDTKMQRMRAYLLDNGRLFLDFGRESDDRPFTAKIEYVWVDNAFVAETGTTSVLASTDGDRARRPGPAVITGFNINFAEGEKNLRSVIVDIGSYSTTIVRFHDGWLGEWNDKVTFHIDYAILQE